MGPMAQEALLSFALERSSAERPSTSRRLTSFPRVAPLISPREETARTTSGSGLFQVEIGWSPTSAWVPTEDRTWALEKTSASGPIPTSRYWLQSPSSIRAAFTSPAASEPGTTLERLSPMRAPMRARMASARAGSPAACSSMTRSTMERAKVTPHALTDCRSHGASHSNDSSDGSRRSPGAARTNAAASSSSITSRTVGDSLDVMSRIWPARTVTTQGPIPRLSTRPIQRPLGSS